MDWPTDPINPGVRARLSSLAAEFQAGRPFRHVVIDDFLVPEIAEAMLAEFPGCPDPSGLKDEFGEPNPRTTIADVRSLGGVYAALDQAIQTPAFLGAMEALAGIEGFRYDPGYFGGGTHESFSGAGLDPHCDFNVHPQTGQRRRVNVLVYLNKDWDPAWRGSLCLHSNPWDPEHDHISEVVPVFNRCIIFETSDTSWHSVLPVSLPDDKRHFSRKSFALYLYTDVLPGERKLIEHSTIYAQRGLAPHIKPGHTLTERDARDIRAGLERRDRHIRALYARETIFSAEITAMRAHIEELRRATYVPLVGYARIETIAAGVHFDRFMGPRLEFAMRLFRPALGLRLIAFRPADLGETMEIEMNVAGMRTHAAVTPGHVRARGALCRAARRYRSGRHRRERGSSSRRRRRSPRAVDRHRPDRADPRRRRLG